MAVQTKTIVIKVNDAYFLQFSTFTANYNSNPNLNKVVVGRNFLLPQTTNITNRINILYPLINPTSSVTVFSNLFTILNRLPNRPKLESLFAIIDARFAVDLMEKAKSRTGFIGENLLNYYYMDVEIPNTAALMSIVTTLKGLPGVDYVYVRGELTALETPISIPLIGKTDKLDAIQWDAIEIQDKPNQIENSPRTSPSLEKKSEIAPLVNSKLANKLPDAMLGKFEETKPDESLSQNRTIPIENIPIIPTTPRGTGTTGTSIELMPISDKIRLLFRYCGLDFENIVPEKKITVVDFEQGWNFVQNDVLYAGLASTILGGSYNHSLPRNRFHGQRTLNILFGNRTNRNQIDGLCKSAIGKIASPWFGANIKDKQPEPALVKTLIESGIVEGDIVLLEVQLDRWYMSNLPVETESALYAVIKAGVQAGYIIVEAAGNGGKSIDTLTPPNTSQTTSTMTTENPPVNLSQNSLGTGSIMVGGRKSDLSIDRTNLNYGSRIDSRVDYYCFAESSKTSSDKPTAPVDFSSTSLASAITAALIARFQSHAMNAPAQGGIGRRLTITEIKKLLSSIPYPDTPTTLPTPINFQHFLSSRGITPVSTVSIQLP